MLRFRLFLAGLINFFALSIGKTQNYIPMPESNTLWVEGSSLYNAYAGHALAFCDGPLFFGADTTINTVVYHTLWGQQICKWDNMPVSPPPPGTPTTGTDFYPNQLRVIFRQDSIQKKVFIYHSNQEHLLYDFSNLVIGQPYPATYTNGFYPNLLVMAYDSVLYNGIYHERWILGTSSLDSGAVAVIEGIGTTQGFAKQILMPFESMNYLLCFSRNGVEYFSDWSAATGLIVPASYGVCDMTISVPEYQNENLMQVFPNPAENEIQINYTEPFHRMEILNIQGQTISDLNITPAKSLKFSIADLPAGSYFIRITCADSFEVCPVIIAR